MLAYNTKTSLALERNEDIKSAQRCGSSSVTLHLLEFGATK